MGTQYIYAPKPYINLTTKQKERMCNGCGSKFAFLVPNSLLFVGIKECCNIHDYMYEVGKTLSDKEEADRVFRNNCHRVVITHSKSKLLRSIRLWMANRYYEAVKNYGSSAFWENKNAEENKIKLNKKG